MSGSHAGHSLVLHRESDMILVWCSDCRVRVMEVRPEVVPLEKFLKAVLHHVSAKRMCSCDGPPHVYDPSWCR
jgi:hypothetical protein